MDEKQRYAFDTVKNGHNVVITGQAGTGKSFLIKEIIEELSSTRKIAVTASTGIAATMYSCATTLHKWAGIGDGRYSNSEILNLVNTDERFAEGRKRILETELLIIDEISMISKRILNQVEFLCRKITENENLFGSIQVVLVGDFFQLPPVKDVMYGDHGHYCFEADWFLQCFPHRVNLTTVYRQSEEQLANAVNELERGCPSLETERFIYSLKRPLEDNSNVVKLFARNMEVDLYNASKLETNPNDTYLCKSHDEGDSFYLKSMQAPRYLAVKKGAPVMLLINLSDKLVNGSRGAVTDFFNDNITVKFTLNDKEISVAVKKHLFSKYDPVSKRNVATRSQYPIRLAYGITIHKSQGMSLETVEVDCHHIFNPGQLGVAVGRATATSGLRVVNFHPSLCKKHPPKVYEFCDALDDSAKETDKLDSLKCCRYQVNSYQEETNITQAVPEHEFELEYDSDFLQEIGEHSDLLNDLDDTEEDQSFISDHTYASSDVKIKDSDPQLERVLQDFIDTPGEAEARQSLKLISRKGTVLTDFLTSKGLKIRESYDSCVPEKPEQKHFTLFYTEFNRYLCSVEYAQSVEKVAGADEMGRQLLTSLMFLMQGDVLKEKAKVIEKTPTILSIQPSAEREISDAGRGKTRYIGGYTIAKIKYRISKSIHNCLFVPGLESELKKLKTQLNITDVMCVSAAEISSVSEYKDTLHETARKQYISGGLTNISDSAFRFFEQLELLIRRKLSYESLVRHKKYLFRDLRDSLCNDTSLLENFCAVYRCCRQSTVDGGDKDLDHGIAVSSVLDLLVEEVDSLDKVLKMIINLFLVVSISQFRKDYLTAIRREKSKALRKKVMEKADNKAKDIDMGFIQADKSEQKVISHLRLKACALQNENFYKQFTKKHLSQLVKAYGSKILISRSKKSDLGQELVLKLQDSSDMPYPHFVNISTGMVSLPEDRCKVPDPNLEIPSTSMELSDQSQDIPGPSSDIHGSPSDIPGPSSDIHGSPSDIPGPSSDIHGSPSDIPGPSSDIPGSPSDIPGPSSDIHGPPSDIPAPSTSESASTNKQKKAKGQRGKSVTNISKGKGKGKGKRKGKRKKTSVDSEITDDSSENCGICSKPYKDSEDWICCDICALWYHRDCVGLEDDEDWNQCSISVYTCPLCL